MEFLKKNYEKVLLGVVLLGLTAGVASLPIIISNTREKLDKVKGQELNRPVQPLKPVQTNLEVAALQRVPAAFKLDFTTKHNLFNPVKWVKMTDGRIVKIVGGTEIEGPGALELLATHALMLKLTYKSKTEGGYLIRVEDQASTKPPHDSIVTMGLKTSSYNLLEAKGAPEKPSELVLEVKDTGENISIKPDQPYQVVNGYSADLKYPPEPGWVRSNERLGHIVRFGGETYKIVAITQSNIVISAANNKKTTISLKTPLADSR